MPTETFLNLKPDKRERIIDASLDEFAANSYHQASLSRIVSKAGIAKGSMYQYFEDKFDLYVYLLSLASDLKLNALRAGVARLGPEADVFDRLRVASREGMAAIYANPRMTMLGNRMMVEGPEFLAKVLARFGPIGEDIIGGWLQASIQQGMIDPEVDPRAAYFLLTSVIAAIGQETATGRLAPEQAGALLEQSLDILKFGMHPRDGNGKGSADVG